MQQRSPDSGQPNTIEVEVAGQAIRLSYESRGLTDRPTVLLLHGWGSSAHVMRPIAKWLASRFFVINVDLPGHGRSPKPPVSWGVPEHAELVRNVAERLIDGAFYIVGHSNGGRIALYLASEDQRPAWLKGMVLISPSGVRRARTAAYHIRRTTAVVLKAPFQILPARMREFGLDWLRHSLVWRFLGSSDYQNVQGVMRETFVKTVNCYLENRLPYVDVPTLLVWGDQDDAVSYEQVSQMATLIPDAGLVIAEGAGHYAFLDRPEFVRAATLEFLTHS